MSIQHNTTLPYSGLFSKQKFSQERENLNFEDLKFRKLHISKNVIIRNSYARVRNQAVTIENGVCDHLCSVWVSRLQRYLGS